MNFVWCGVWCGVVYGGEWSPEQLKAVLSQPWMRGTGRDKPLHPDKFLRNDDMLEKPPKVKLPYGGMCAVCVRLSAASV